MSENNLNHLQIQSILSDYNKDQTEKDSSSFQLIEGLSDIVLTRYNNYKIGNEEDPVELSSLDPTTDRSSDFDFYDAVKYSEIAKPELSQVERRIMASDLAVLNWAIPRGGLDAAVSRELNKLNESERKTIESSPDSTMQFVAEIAERFIVKKRGQNNEAELSEKYPYAPTTGFEYEYIEPFRFMVDEFKRTARSIKLLEAAKENVLEQMDWTGYDRSDAMYVFYDVPRLYEECRAIDPALTYESLLNDLIDRKFMRLQAFREILKVPITIPPQSHLERSPARNAVQIQAASLLASAQKLVERARQTGQRNLDVESMVGDVNRQLQLVLGKLVLTSGDHLQVEDLNSIRMIVPSQARRLKALGLYSKVHDELFVGEELVSKPSVSVRMQIRDFIYAAKLGAFNNHLTVHQTVGGIELTTTRNDFMEVNAILEAADLNVYKDDLTPRHLDIIESGKNVLSPIFKKASRSDDGNFYYFPYHVSKQLNSSDPYPSERRTLVEVRESRAVNPSTSFMKHAKASLFTWLSAWGEQAFNTPEESRTPEQHELAQCWSELLENWGTLIEEKNIYQPTAKERFQNVEIDPVTHDQTLLGDEKYTHYVQSITAKRIRERSLTAKEEKSNSLLIRSRHLIREYTLKTMAIIDGKKTE